MSVSSVLWILPDAATACRCGPADSFMTIVSVAAAASSSAAACSGTAGLGRFTRPTSRAASLPRSSHSE